MPQNKAARFDLSKVPQELKKPALEHLLAYRTFKDKETAHKKLCHQMVNDFRPKESTFRDGTVTIKQIVDEDFQRQLHQNECELQLQFHQKDLDAAQDKHKATHKAFNEAMKSYYDAYTSLSTDYKVDLTEVDTQDALMDLVDGNNFQPIVDVVMTTARQHVQHTVKAMVTARRRIDLEAKAKHTRYVEHFDKKLIERATRVQNKKVREEVNKAMAANAIVQGQAEQIKIMTEAVRQLMVDNKQQHAKNGRRRGGGTNGDKSERGRPRKRGDETPPTPNTPRARTPRTGSNTPRRTRSNAGNNSTQPRAPRGNTPRGKRKKETSSGKKRANKRGKSNDAPKKGEAHECM